MAKIIVTFNGLVQQEYAITKQRITIGRRPSNDLIIDHLTVSGQHAAIDTTPNGCFVLDLGSTNGTMVNSQPVKKHLLQQDDIIDIGKYKLRFQEDKKNPSAPSASSGAKESPQVVRLAKVKVLNGSNAGKELSLTKPVTTIGSPGVQVIAITRQGNDYAIRHVEGKIATQVNGVDIQGQQQTLRSGDVVELAGTQMKFVCT
ncbi:FHA domain-containing protein [Undibacterium sp. SXout7W]|uniref:FHA domain-containing protein n=1 Tax=Undibacterium sp. SXout7W TaxID=3413049 RepID=UPI003BF29145